MLYHVSKGIFFLNDMTSQEGFFQKILIHITITNSIYLSSEVSNSMLHEKYGEKIDFVISIGENVSLRVFTLN